MTRRCLLFVLLCSPFIYSQTLNKESIWQGFLDWLKDVPISGPGNPIQFYQDTLISKGTPEREVAQNIAVIREYMYSRNEGMAVWFNRMYKEGSPAHKPNSFLAQAMQDLNPGTALDVSMGEGRNSVYLAQNGWDVTGFDVSDEGISVAQNSALKAGVKIKTVLSGYQDFDFGKDKWDLVAMIYAFFPMRDEVYVNRLIDSIKPGGILVFEHHMFTGPSDQREEAGKVGILTQNELLRIFDSFRVLRYEESNIISEWGSGTPSPVIRLFAQKI
jgi:2-polyprenyl-3-methyl-5-hydroxy-6-metoxy-1,4-benzoquinol methylase